MSAMQDELRRSMAELRMKDEAPPYFIAYEVLDRTLFEVAGRLGAVIEDQPRRVRMLRAEVRVGDYAFDSSRFVLQGFGGVVHWAQMPVYVAAELSAGVMAAAVYTVVARTRLDRTRGSMTEDFVPDSLMAESVA